MPSCHLPKVATVFGVGSEDGDVVEGGARPQVVTVLIHSGGDDPSIYLKR